MNRNIILNYKTNKKGITIGPLEEEHLALLKKWRNRQIDILRQTQILNNKDQLRWFTAMRKDAHQMIFSIKENGRLVGYCGLVHIDDRHKRAEISFLLDSKIAEDKKLYKLFFIETLKNLCSYGFDQLHLNKVFTDTFYFRKNHINILEEFGFKREAVLREHYFKKGRYCNSIIHSILRKEWVKIKNEIKKKN